jgi:CDP-diacylglycerol--glycerol-3-phosphate 3-phosphatidyltransferase
MDVLCSLSIVAALALLALTYGARVALHGRARSARVDREGKSALLGKSAMEMMYWTVAPLGAGLARLGVSANAVTWASLAVAVAAGVALGAGHFGLGALLALVSAAGDAIDGFVARATGTASDAGEVLDAAVDRYVELAFLGGVAVALRGSVPSLVLTMLAIAASFMVSYSTAKAEALQIEPPRGSMRRTERAVVLVTGAGLTPLFALLPLARATGEEAWSHAPMIAALAIVAVVGNASAARRLASIAASVRLREAAARAAVTGASPGPARSGAPLVLGAPASVSVSGSVSGSEPAAARSAGR